MGLSVKHLRCIFGPILLLTGISLTYMLLFLNAASIHVVKNAIAEKVDWTVITPVENVETESTTEIKSEKLFTPTKASEIYFPRWIAYNKVNKCGSRSLVEVVKELGQKNNFTVNNGGFFHGNYVSKQDVIIKQVRYLDGIHKPLFYYTHFYYVNFNKYGIPNPVYINLIRDPVDRFVSLYNFQKYGDNKGIGGKTKDKLEINMCVTKNLNFCKADGQAGVQIANFFCGQNTGICNDVQETVRVAKQHIDENYVFIGLTEEFDASLQILERLLPDYFGGARKVWDEIRKQTLYETKTSKKEELTPESRRIMQKRLAPDYEIYNHVKKKFNDLKKQFNIR